MKGITKYSKKIKMTYAGTALAVCGIFAVAFPWFKGMSTTDEGYYSVVLNGEKIGVVASPDVADDAYLDARLKIENENDAAVYIDYDLKVYEEDRLYGKKMSEDDLAAKMYDLLKDSYVQIKEKAYVVDIEGFTVTLDSKEAVVELLNAAKSKYDDEDMFTTVLTDSEDSRFSYISYEFVNVSTQGRDNLVVTVMENGTEPEMTKEALDYNGIVSINFSENVEIIETYVSSSQITELDKAIEMVTKEKEENKVYEVTAGDTLTGIADSFNLTMDKLLAMNPDYSEEGYLMIGDRINVTVPEPELSVEVSRRQKYEEEYNLPVEYVYNDSQYTTYSNVISEGESGYRQVVADISYVNGEETGRNILEQEVVKEASPKVIEVGTVTPPTFIKPISGGIFSSGFGFRWGKLHKGIDWACSTGTSIMASCGGTVVQSGWNGGYGYCVTIDHGNGIQTRYAHMSQTAASYGQYVKQGEVIGRSGNTGNSTGPHLHFEIIVSGTAVNPFTYLN